MSARRRARAEARLAAAMNRLAADLRRSQAVPPPPASPRPQPHTDWEQQTESRLRAIEQQLTNQNRLLLAAILTLAGDMALGLTR